ncbi:MAG TPA: protein kinase [Vicinamibacteria bacterium]|nr:protein kinase [Vicinamibacteria bacterium]
MSLAAGGRLGAYQLVAPLGKGGMGEVWRARDTRLERDVAVKVLPRGVARDAEALARFEREAKAVAALSHPNILAIHDVGTHDETAYAVMELLEGEDLRERLGSGAVPPARTLEYAVQIAQGLAAAHERGIVHRDLKPENVFLTKDGQVKILDFGLARQARPPSADDDTNTPTLSRQTSAGLVVGTMGYMSPEQVRGQPVDHRSDIFVFGCLVQEMLVGAKVFRQETGAETMVAILRNEPADLPEPVRSALPGIEHVLRHCLEKRPEDRFQSTRDLVFALKSVGPAGSDSGRARTRASAEAPGRRRLAAAIPWALAGAVLGALAAHRLSSPASVDPPRIRRLTFSGADSEPSASPDGRLVAFTSRRDGISRIWIKQLAGGGEAALTAGPDRLPRFSPDGSSVLFVRDEGTAQSVYRIALVGGEPRKLVHDAVDADWSPDGRAIAFVRPRAEPGRTFAGVHVADAQGGKERRLAETENASFFGVRWSPDGRTIGVTRATVASTSLRAGVTLFDARSGAERSLDGGGVRPVSALAWQGGGEALVLARSENQLGNLTAAPSRVVARAVRGESERMLFWATDLFPAGGNSNVLPVFDVVGPGRLVFDAIEEHQALREVPLGPASSAGGLLTAGRSIDRQPAYAPDGEHVVFSSNRSGNLDLWLVSTRTRAARQLTDDPADDWDPAFTPDGRQIVWSSSRSGNLEIWIAERDGSGARQLTHGGQGAENPTVAPDGWVVYTDDNPSADFRGIWKVRSDGSAARRLLAGPHSNPEVSPDGRLALAVQTDPVGLRNRIRVVEVESGRIVPFAIEVAYRLDSPNIVLGRARWSPDGKAIAFVGIDTAGRTGVFLQDFTPGRDSAASRRSVAGFASDHVTESFGIAPDGRRLTLSTLEQFASLLLAEGVPGVDVPRRSTP